ncbi:MAG: NAD(P)H-dependent oxidoreductase [Calditrichota bacterium]
MVNDKHVQIKIVGICGSLRKDSYTRSVLDIALKSAQENGAETQLIDLRKFDLVFFDEDRKDDYPADVEKLRMLVRNAHGILLGTPEYHGGISGVLKNAMDLMGFKEFEGKMLGLLGVSGGQLGALNALNSLRTIGRNLHAWVLPQQVSLPEAWKAFDEDGQLKNPAIEKRIKEVGKLITQFATLHDLQNHKEFVQMWQRLANNPGGTK